MNTNERLPKRTSHLLATIALAGVAVAAWAGWLGWDQQRDVHPDGSTTGPYEAWQVIGLVLTLLPAVYWAASRRYTAAAVIGTTAGLTVAAYVDWSDDASGLFMIGVCLVMMGSLVVTSALSAVIAALTGHGRGRPGGRRWSVC
ncbi:hypothetical protein ACFC1L_28065 [Streptomyces sp. NPDC056210]|uniref:hypothetical protein n=1 Tax=Streptomyces TaxID=1883 RepID=UPI001D0A0BDD|nr:MULTISPECIES: hypothetical protein [Streptomyces]MCX5083101.1 hypothetical protein [Streptomyces sp. NBC_00401]UDM01207.1 hypothetical protein LGI35_24515 [Streptomyces longhuiensis]